MTADEFERAYAERSGTTVEQLRALGRIVAPCDCGEDMCEGWQSTTVERLEDEKERPMRGSVSPAAGVLGTSLVCRLLVGYEFTTLPTCHTRTS